MVHSESGDLALALASSGAVTAPAGCVRLPAHAPSIDDAYAIQRRVAAIGGSPVQAWKLGLTGEGPREAFGASEPTLGRLSAEAIHHDGSLLPFAGAEMYAEAEIFFVLARDLPEQERAYTRADVREALEGVYAGIEIARTRFETSDLSLPQLIADNSMAHALVSGGKLASGWEDRFADMPVSLTRNGAAPVEGSTSRVMGSPLDALVWIANWLREHEGYALRRGQIVASGTCTGATEVFAGDTISAGFDGATMVRVSLGAIAYKEKLK